MYLVPPMDEEPPPDFVAFVAVRLDELHREAHRLVGGASEGGYIYMDVLADLAGHWRRLRWWSRLTGREAAADYLRRRLAMRTRQWRDDQVYEVDVRVLRPPLLWAAFTAGPASGSLALRKAAVLPGTKRGSAMPVAEAGIAWVHAYRRQQWRRIGRAVAWGILLIGGLIQYMTALSTGY